MNITTGVRVRIYDEEKCIHEHETIRSDGNDLRTLIQNLRDVQSEINCFLTTLIQRRDVSSGTVNSLIVHVKIVIVNNFFLLYYLCIVRFLQFDRNDESIDLFGR